MKKIYLIFVAWMNPNNQKKSYISPLPPSPQNTHKTKTKRIINLRNSKIIILKNPKNRKKKTSKKQER
jgi:hypothetical protein